MLIDDDILKFIENLNETVELEASFKTYMNMFAISISSQNNGVLSFQE